MPDPWADAEPDAGPSTVRVVGGTTGEDDDTPAAARTSGVWLKPPCVMLVRLEHGEEPPELGLGERNLRVVRVRHPVPACHRMRIVRPAVVILGPSVRDWDFALLQAAAQRLGTAMLRLGPLVSTAAIPEWFSRVLDRDVKLRTREVTG